MIIIVIDRDRSPCRHFKIIIIIAMMLVVMCHRLNTGHIEWATCVDGHILVYGNLIKNIEQYLCINGQSILLGGIRRHSLFWEDKDSPKYSITSFRVTSQIWSASSSDDMRRTCSTWYGMAGISRSTSISGPGVFSPSRPPWIDSEIERGLMMLSWCCSVVCSLLSPSGFSTFYSDEVFYWARGAYVNWNDVLVTFGWLIIVIAAAATSHDDWFE